MTEVDLTLSCDCFLHAQDVSDELSEEVLMLSKTGHVNLGTNEQVSPLGF